MPINIKIQTKPSLVAQAVQYKILFSFKKDSGKQVFKALREDPSTGIQQEVLLKIFLKEEESYREEFESLSQVDSPYCVRLFGFENFAGKKALVLEYIKGVSLFQLVRAYPLCSGEIQHILTETYKGLKDLSQQGFCHGDLSLDNILIDEKACIKLIDFGRANYEQRAQGTPPFMAPEIFQGARANFLSDLYSLGAIEAILNQPELLPSLKDVELKGKTNKSSLLSADPQQRHFPLELKERKTSKKDIKTLSYKVKDLSDLVESRRCVTLKEHKSPVAFKNFFKSIFLFLILLFAGIAPSQASVSFPGWIKIYTNQWFAIRIKDFKSYTPAVFSLREGWHLIEWKNKKLQGKKKIFVPSGKTIILNDKNFIVKKGNFL